VRHFFRQALPGREPPALEDAVRDLLVRRDYPGNVRDLRSLVLRISHRYLGTGVVTVGDMPEDERPASGPPAPAWCSQAFEESIRRSLAQGASLEEITATAADVAARLAADGAQRAGDA
jgi:transcriptional regulator of acetoin/glycerol metabolism